MTLAPGTRLGPYEIVAPLGAGGMGEVYRASDSKLRREVALKVLPEAFARDPERMARFEREAQILASLNHPNIGVIYGLEESSGVRALVMELVEGATLAERIAQDPLALGEALPIAKQIAEALEYAHERGIIHRDLKPANIKLTRDGAVKVLDFGLAKALEGDAAEPDISKSPTISMAATRAGIIFGTAAYMSPEQAKGKPVDRRADIWAFGCVLYEMLTEQQLFTGETASDVLAHVIMQEPDWGALPAVTPAPIRKLLERTLRKEVKARLQAIGEARIAIEEYLANPATASASGIFSAAAMAAPQRLWRRALLWAGMALLALVALLAVWRPWQTAPNPGVMRLSTEFGGEGTLPTGLGPSALISPDGTHMVFVASDAGGKQRLFIRSLDQLQVSPLYGTEDAIDPFFSPDGQWIAFFAGGKLKKISVQGGAAVTLCDAQEDRGGAWGENGTIIFAPATRTGLFMVSSAGGTPAPFSTLDKKAGEVTHRWPQFLPGGKALLYTSDNNGTFYEEADVAVQVLATGQKKKLFHGGYHARYLPGGYLAFLHDGTLFAVPFDAKRLEIAGQPAPILEDVMSDATTAGAQFSFSGNGTFVYVSGRQAGAKFKLSWLASDGRLTPLRDAALNYTGLSFSPDGKLLALEITDTNNKRDDIWVHDWQRDTVTRLTFARQQNYEPAWTPDSKRITYTTSEQSGDYSFYWKRADGAGDEQKIVASKNSLQTASWRPDSKVLVFAENNPDTNWDIMTLPMEGDEKNGWKPGEVKPFLNSTFSELRPAFSPDGRWLAYRSNELGVSEIYVRPFPGPGGKWQISTGGGDFPQWSSNGRELFYLTNDNKLMVATYSASGDSFRADSPRLWSNIQLANIGPYKNFSLHPDGKRIAAITDPQTKAQGQPAKITFVVNFTDELRRKLAPAR